MKITNHLLKNLFIIICVIVSNSAFCFAQLKGISSVSNSDDPDFANPLSALKELVRAKSRNNNNNTFYVSKLLSFENGLNQVWVYWKENKSLILWEPHLSGADTNEELLLSRRYLRFGKEIVPANRYYEGSNFLTLLQDGLAIKNECLKEGRKFTIKKSRYKNLKRQ